MDQWCTTITDKDIYLIKGLSAPVVYCKSFSGPDWGSLQFEICWDQTCYPKIVVIAKRPLKFSGNQLAKIVMDTTVSEQT